MPWRSGENNSFVNQTQIPLLCEKSGAILLVPVGLMTGRQSDKTREDLKFLKSSTDCIVRIFTAFYEGTVLL